MAKLYYVLGASVLAAGAVVCALAFAGSQRTKARASGAVTNVLDESSAQASDPPEVVRLRAELQRRDAIIRAMAASRVEGAGAAAAPVPAAPADGSEDPTVEACDTLDERLFTAPPDGRRTAEMERAVEAMLDPKALGRTKVSSRHCGATLCKLVLRGESAASLNESMIAVAERMPKLFSGSIVYPTGANESALYLATNRDELNVDPPPEIHLPPETRSDAQNEVQQRRP